MKLSKHAWTIWGILLVVALVLMVLIPFSRTASWWIAAGCTVLMFLLAAWTFYAAFRKDGLESKILGWRGFVSGANFSVRRVCWLRRGRCVPPEMLLMSFLQNGFQPLHSGCCGGLVCDLYYFQMRMRQDAPRIFRSG